MIARILSSAQPFSIKSKSYSLITTIKSRSLG